AEHPIKDVDAKDDTLWKESLDGDSRGVENAEMEPAAAIGMQPSVLQSVLDDGLSRRLRKSSQEIATVENGRANFIARFASHQVKFPEAEVEASAIVATVSAVETTPAHEIQEMIYDVPMSHPAMYVHRFCLLQYRRMMRFGRTPHPSELAGTWRGVNKGVATMAIDRQFIKQFYYVNGRLYGDNISVHQVADSQLQQCGWRPIVDPYTGQLKRQGRFAVECPQGIGPFRHGLVLNYAAGGNGRDPSRMIWDQVVKLDDNHMLGRATIRVGLAKVPVAFFVLERIPEPTAPSQQPAPSIQPTLQVSK
ncbi:MAG: hypothetical protein ACR2NP_01790, partial [Pirellulaceae bacterium]